MWRYSQPYKMKWLQMISNILCFMLLVFLSTSTGTVKWLVHNKSPAMQFCYSKQNQNQKRFFVNPNWNRCFSQWNVQFHSRLTTVQLNKYVKTENTDKNLSSLTVNGDCPILFMEASPVNTSACIVWHVAWHKVFNQQLQSSIWWIWHHNPATILIRQSLSCTSS